MSEFSTQHLSGAALDAAKAIRNCIGENAQSECRAFYTPQEWVERGEQFGTESVLVVVHDGGDHAPYFNYDYMVYESTSQMESALEKAGFYFENCTAWYSAIYLADKS